MTFQELRRGDYFTFALAANDAHLYRKSSAKTAVRQRNGRDGQSVDDTLDTVHPRTMVSRAEPPIETSSRPRTFAPDTSLVTLNAFTTTELARIALSDALTGYVLVQPHRDGYYVILEDRAFRANGSFLVKTLHGTYPSALAAALTYVSKGGK